MKVSYYGNFYEPLFLSMTFNRCRLIIIENALMQSPALMSHRCQLNVYSIYTPYTQHTLDVDLTYTWPRLGRVLSPLPLRSHLPLLFLSQLLLLIPFSSFPLSSHPPCLPPSLRPFYTLNIGSQDSSELIIRKILLWARLG